MKEFKDIYTLVSEHPIPIVFLAIGVILEGYLKSLEKKGE